MHSTPSWCPAALGQLIDACILLTLLTPTSITCAVVPAYHVQRSAQHITRGICHWRQAPFFPHRLTFIRNNSERLLVTRNAMLLLLSLTALLLGSFAHAQESQLYLAKLHATRNSNLCVGLSDGTYNRDIVLRPCSHDSAIWSIRKDEGSTFMRHKNVCLNGGFSESSSPPSPSSDPDPHHSVAHEQAVIRILTISEGRLGLQHRRRQPDIWSVLPR